MDLFPETMPPRPPQPVRRVMMHVADAGEDHGGNPVIRFSCSKCGHDTGWIYDDLPVSGNRRGLPCPVCCEARDKCLRLMPPAIRITHQMCHSCTEQGCQYLGTVSKQQ